MQYSDGVVASHMNGTIQQKGITFKVNDDVFLPAAWSIAWKIMAYTSNGYTNKTWTLPSNWDDVASVDLYEVKAGGRKLLQANIPVINHQVTLSLGAGKLGVVVPATEAPSKGYISGKMYRITPNISGKAVVVDGVSLTNGANAIQYD
jgi:hypothetical protein